MGKTKYIETPEKLWELFESYVKKEKESPMYKREYVGKEGRAVDTPLEVPITFEGFECYLCDIGVIDSHLGHYCDKNNPTYADYLPIITRIRANCFTHNYKGAAVGLFNANLVAKKLGLAAKIEQTNIEQPLFPDDKK